MNYSGEGWGGVGWGGGVFFCNFEYQEMTISFCPGSCIKVRCILKLKIKIFTKTPSKVPISCF